MQSSDARILRGAAIPTGLVGVAIILVSLLVAGTKGALGAAIGLAVVVVFFSISVIAVSYASKISPAAMMPAALGSYLIKLVAMFALIALLAGVDVWNTRAFAWTVIVLTLVWTFAEARTSFKHKHLTVEPGVRPPGHEGRSA